MALESEKAKLQGQLTSKKTEAPVERVKPGECVCLGGGGGKHGCAGWIPCGLLQVSLLLPCTLARAHHGRCQAHACGGQQGHG